MPKYIRAISFFLILLALSFVLIALWPYLQGFSQGVPSFEISAYPEYQLVSKALEQELRSIPQEKLKGEVRKSEVGQHTLSWLTYVDFIVTGKRKITPELVTVTVSGPGEVKLRYDRLISSLALIACLALVLWFVDRHVATTVSIPLTAEAFASVALPEMLIREVGRWELHCQQQARRSRFLLVGGIIAAIAGIGVLYFFVSVQEAKKGLNDLSALARAFGVVLYVEAFAFLLLRQYRMSEEDYRYFNSMRLRNIHYLMALKAISSGMALGEGPTVSRILLNEDPFRGIGSAKGGGEAAPGENGFGQLVRPLLPKDGPGKEAAQP